MDRTHILLSSLANTPTEKPTEELATELEVGSTKELENNSEEETSEDQEEHAEETDNDSGELSEYENSAEESENVSNKNLLENNSAEEPPPKNDSEEETLENDSEEELVENDSEEELVENDTKNEPPEDNSDEEVVEDSDEEAIEENFEDSAEELEHVMNTSNDKKRSVDATIGELTPKETSSRKKPRQEYSTMTTPQTAISKEDIDKDTPAQKGESGSSGKRRRNRWETQTIDESDDRIIKRRKTRWDVDESQLKMLGPMRLANFMEKFLEESNWDVENRQMKERLAAINNILKCTDMYNNNNEETSVKLRNKLMLERQDIISKLVKGHPAFQTPTDYMLPVLTKKLYIPVKEYPEYNFIGVIIGPRGNTLKRMEKESGANIYLRGKGSVKTPSKRKSDPSDNEDLHVLIRADNGESLNKAVEMVEKLLNPFNEGWSEHKASQLKEISKQKRTYIDSIKCRVCNEEGHMQYACPSLNSTFQGHYTASSNLTAPYQLEKENEISPGQNVKKIDEANLFVRYLPTTIDDNRLSELFSPFGKLNDVKVIKDRNTGKSKGYGFVKFENSSDACAALRHTNGLKIDGKMLAVKVADDSTEKQVAPSEISPFSHLPVYPGSPSLPYPFMGNTVISSSGILTQMRPFPPPFPYSGQSYFVPLGEPFAFSTPPSASNLPDSLSSNGSSSSYKRFNPVPFTKPSPLATPPFFSGDPNYNGSSLFM